MRTRLTIVTMVVTVVATSCSSAVVEAVDDGSFAARVPTTEQLITAAAVDIPGGFRLLRDSGVDNVEVHIEGDEATFRVDETVVATRQVLERINVGDAEGSGPFKAQKEVLVLGDDPLTLAELTIEKPVIWPGDFEESPVITLKPWDPDERGPVVSCAADETCLVFSAPVDPVGRYADANDPALGQNPIASIEIAEEIIEFTLDSEVVIRTDRFDKPIGGCGLATSATWDVPEAVGLTFEDPVLIHTLCPSVPGAAVQLVIMERAAVPVLAPLSEATGGEWCQAGGSCLWFVPE